MVYWELLPLLPAAVVAVSVYKGIPILVLVRRARPILVATGATLWFAHRVLGVTGVDASLLDLAVYGIKWIESYTLDWFPSVSFLLRFLWLVLEDVMAIVLVRSIWGLLYKARHITLREAQDGIIQGVFEFAKAHVAFVQQQLAKIRSQTQDTIRHSLRKDPARHVHRSLPAEGVPRQQLLKEMRDRAAVENAKWQTGKISGTVYPADKEHTELMNNVYAAYSWSNPLHIGVWPSVNQYEAEVVTMTANLLNGMNQVVGTTTSGGTESIVLAIRAHAVHYGRQRGIDVPEIICGSTAHASVDKACDLMGLRKVLVECDPHTFTMSPKAVEKRITSHTILIYASAPCYPQGVIDPIEELSELASRYEIGLHVDACLGGFVLPFARDLGNPIPKFDFECPGVTSMSVDTHKYGYSSKGTSVVLYRNEALRRAQYFACAQWTGGLYITPTIAGSRPGALFACAWAAMMSHGESGYKARVQSILDASKKITKGIEEISGLRLMGRQKPTMVVCFGSEDESKLDIYRVGDEMTNRGYELNALQRPACLHVCVTMSVVAVVDIFLHDLRQAVAKVQQEGNKANKRGSAAIYGMAGSFPAGPINEMLQCVPDAMFAP